MDFKYTKLDKDQTIGFTYKNTNYYKLSMTVLEAFKTLGARTRDVSILLIRIIIPVFKKGSINLLPINAYLSWKSFKL